MENEELVFVLNSAELTENGFEGSFEDFVSKLEEMGASVREDEFVDDDYNEVPGYVVIGISQSEMNQLLSDFGVEDPEMFTEPSDEFGNEEDNFPFGYE